MGSIPITCFENEYFIYYARVAQLVEHDLAKVGVAGSSPVSRSFYTKKGILPGYLFLYKRVLPDSNIRGLHSVPQADTALERRSRNLFRYIVTGKTAAVSDSRPWVKHLILLYAALFLSAVNGCCRYRTAADKQQSNP